MARALACSLRSSRLGDQVGGGRVRKSSHGNRRSRTRLSLCVPLVVKSLDSSVRFESVADTVDIKNGARFSDEVRQFEMSLIRTALGRTSGSQTRAAKLLGLKPTTLNAKIKRYGIMA